MYHQDMIKNPLVSVVVPIYNVEQYLERCLNSIVNQTYKNLEIILVDDGSTDSSGKICDKYNLIYTNIKVIHKKNGGLSSARNIGIECFNGEYLLFVDSDDFLNKDCIEISLKKILMFEADICIFNYFECNTTNTQSRVLNKLENRLIGKEEIFNKFLTNSKVIYVLSWNKLYARAVIKNIHFPENRIYEDLAVCLDIYQNCSKIIQIDRPLYHYTIRPESLSHATFNWKNENDFLYAMSQNINYFFNNNYNTIGNHIFYVLINHYCSIEDKVKRNENKHYSEYRRNIAELYKNNRKKISFTNALFFHFPNMMYTIRKLIISLKR